MSVSVVIPSYNCGQWVVEAVESALAQTVPPAQVIVVDDGSTDETQTRLGPLVQRGVEYVRQENAGVSAARNEGVRRATGEFIAFLDADDFWHPQKLEVQMRTMEERPDVNMLGTATFNWPGTVPDVTRASSDVREVPWAALAVLNRFTTSSVLVRRAALEAVGPEPFDRQLQGPEDYDVWLRLAAVGRIANLTHPLTGYRTVVGSLGKQAHSMQAGMGRILQKIDCEGRWGGCLLRRRAYAYFHYSCAYMYGAAGEQGVALAEVLRSLARYPLPFKPGEVRMRSARIKLLGTILLRLARLKRPEETS